MSDPFRLGLVGGGRMGRTHIRALDEATSVRIVAVAEPDQAAAGAMQGNGLAVYPTLAAMLEEGNLDGVLIAAPTDQHLPLIGEIAKARLPILCEKPCGLSAAEAIEAGRIAEARGVPLQVAYWRRFVPSLENLRERIAADGIGVLHFIICAQWDEAPPGPRFRARSGGIFVDMGVHEIDQIRWLTNQEVVGANVSSFPTVADPAAVGDVDSAQALLNLGDGSAALVSLGRFHPGGDLVTAEVYGSSGHVRVEVLQPPEGESRQLEALRRQAESFARWAQGGEPEGATADDARAALAVAHTLSEAAGLRVLGLG